jgi:hypothetical protein
MRPLCFVLRNVGPAIGDGNAKAGVFGIAKRNAATGIAMSLEVFVNEDGTEQITQRQLPGFRLNHILLPPPAAQRKGGNWASHPDPRHESQAAIT